MNEERFIEFQISLSTADVEDSLFTPQIQTESADQPGSELPPGTYRVIDGELFQIVPGASLALG
jgi:hypothetical protein